MTLFLTAIGVALILIVLRDIFYTLFNPSSSGAMSSRIIRFLWQRIRTIARHRPRLLSIAGPVALLATIAIWIIGLMLGWALILWPRLPENFLLSTGLDPAENGSFLDAVYLSTVSLATLGYGDMTPKSTGLRLIAPLEALVGFAIFTAAISWILSIYPVLARRRNLAREVTFLERSGRWGDLVLADDGASALNSILLSLTEQVVFARNDYLQFPTTYYFHQRDSDAALDIAMPRMVVLADQARQHSSTSVRFQANLLHDAIRDLTAYVGESFLGMKDEDPADIFTAYAKDHLRNTDGTAREAGKILDGME